MKTLWNRQFSIIIVISILVTATVVVGLAGSVAADDETIQTDRLERTVVVEENGLIHAAEVVDRLHLTNETHESLTAAVTDDGYEDVPSYYESDYTGLVFTNVTATQTPRPGGYTVEIIVHNITFGIGDDMNVTLQDDMAWYERTDVPDPTEETLFEEYVHTVVMPGEIESTNADEVDGSTATWFLHERHVDPMYAGSDYEGIDVDIDYEPDIDPEDIEVPDTEEYDDFEVNFSTDDAQTGGDDALSLQVLVPLISLIATTLWLRERSHR